MGTQDKKKKAKSALKRKRIYVIVIMLISGYMVFCGCMQNPRINERKEQIDNSNHELEYEKARAEQLEDLKDVQDTDEYIEKVAREKLGLVHEDEKIFIDVSKKDK